MINLALKMKNSIWHYRSSELLDTHSDESLQATSFGHLLPIAKGSNWPIVLKKSLCPNCLIIDW
jgi:hypothetical protein